MEFLTGGWSTVKYLKYDQTIRNFTCGDFKISFVVIRLGVTGLKKTWFVYLLDLFVGRENKGWCDLVWGSGVEGALSFESATATCIRV